MSKGGQEQKTTTTTTMDPWVKQQLDQYLTGLGGIGEQLQQGFNPVPGERQFAGPTGDTLSAYDITRTHGAAGIDQVGAASDLATRVGGMTLPEIQAGTVAGGVAPIDFSSVFSPVSARGARATAGQIDPRQIIAANLGFGQALGAAPTTQAQTGAQFMGQYQNPYTQSVINASMADLNRARQMAVGGVADQATAAKAFGGSRHGIAEAETNRAFADQAAQMAAGLRSQGFQTAAGLGQQDASRFGQIGVQNAQNQLAQRMGIFNQATGLAGQQAGLTTQAGVATSQAKTQANVAQMQARVQQQIAQANAMAQQQALEYASLTGDRDAALRAAGLTQQGQLGIGNLGLGASQALAQQGGQLQGMNLGYANALLGIGGQQQALEQARLDAPYQQNQDTWQRMMAVNQLYGGGLGGLGGYGTTTQTQQMAGGNWLQGLTGGVMAGAGMFGWPGAIAGGLIGGLGSAYG